jgi:hypothetical protein
MSVIVRVGLVALVCLLLPAPADAHTLAGTMVSVRLVSPETLLVTIAAEADPLIAKLEALAGDVSASAPLSQAARRVRLESLFPTLRAHVDARLDGRPLELVLHDTPVDDTAQVELHMTATVPKRSGMFTWQCRFIFGAYQLTATGSDEHSVVEWLQGPQASTPIALAPSADILAWGATSVRIGHSLAMGALVMWVLHRRRRAHRAGG